MAYFGMRLDDTEVCGEITTRKEYVDQAIGIQVMLQEGELKYHPTWGTQITEFLSAPSSIAVPRIINSIVNEMSETTLPEGAEFIGVSTESLTTAALQDGEVSPKIVYSYDGNKFER